MESHPEQVPMFFHRDASKDPKIKMKAWVYIVECSDGLYYTGSTTNLEQRIYDHNTGRFDGFTSFRLPVKLIWFEEFVDIRDAVILERQIKGWSRKKKKALIAGDFSSLQQLSRSTYSKTKEHSSTRSLTRPRSE